MSVAVLLLAEAFSAFSASEPAGALVRLEDVRAQVVRSNAAVRASAMKRAQARSAVGEARAQWLPKVDARVEVTASPAARIETLTAIDEFGDPIEVVVPVFNDIGQDSAAAVTPQLGYRAEIQANWVATDFGQRAAALRAARRRARAAKLRGGVAQRQAVAMADQSWLAWLAADRHRALLLQSRSRAQESLTGVRAREELGASARSEILVAEARLAALDVAKIEADAAVDDARALLVEAGVELAPGSRPDPRFLIDGPRSPELKPERDAAEASLAEARAAEARAEAAERAGRPVLGLSASTGLVGRNQRFAPTYAVGLGLQWPIFDGGTRAAQATAARAQAEDARHEAQLRSDDVDRELEALRLRWARSVARVEAAERFFFAARALAREAEAGDDRSAMEAAWSRLERAEGALLDARVERASAYLAADRSSAAKASPPTDE